MDVRIQRRRFYFLIYFTLTLLFPLERLQHEIDLGAEWEEISHTWEWAKRIWGGLLASFHMHPLQLSTK